MHTLKLSVAALALVMSGGCASMSSSDPATDKNTFRTGTDGWLKAYNAGDVDHIVSLYTADAMIMPPHAPASKGHAAIRSFIAADTAGARAAGIKLVNGPSDSGVSGDVGWHTGSYTVVDKSGVTVDSGHYMECWQRTDGKWLIVRDIWNSDRPAE